MANGIYKVTEEFEERLADYTGSRFAVTVDNMSNGLFLSLYYEHVVNIKEINPTRKHAIKAYPT